MAPDSSNSETPKGWRRLYIWSRPVEPSASPESASPSSTLPSPAVPSPAQPSTAAPKEGAKDLKSVDFQSNFPEQSADSRPTLISAAKSIKKEDFLNIGQVPCARQGLLTGITSGAAIGGLRWVLSGSIRRGANWAVGSFAIMSIASFEFCQYKRFQERVQMKRTVEIIQEKRGEKARKEREEREAQRKEEEERARGKAWYRFW